MVQVNVMPYIFSRRFYEFKQILLFIQKQYFSYRSAFISMFLCLFLYIPLFSISIFTQFLFFFLCCFYMVPSSTFPYLHNFYKFSFYIVYIVYGPLFNHFNIYTVFINFIINPDKLKFCELDPFFPCLYFDFVTNNTIGEMIGFEMALKLANHSLNIFNTHLIFPFCLLFLIKKEHMYLEIENLLLVQNHLGNYLHH